MVNKSEDNTGSLFPPFLHSLAEMIILTQSDTYIIVLLPTTNC